MVIATNLTSICASIRRKLVKTTYTEERSVRTNSENCNIRLGSLKNLFNSKQNPAPAVKTSCKQNIISKKGYEIKMR